MSTNDVPGAVAGNADKLAMGCWAEHKDGSLLFVESTEGSRVIYSMFDMAHKPPIEYRDAMPEASFKTTFSWNGKNEKWTWHDKTPFDWDRVIKSFDDGARYPSRMHIETAAKRVAKSLHLKGAEMKADFAQGRAPEVMDRIEGIFKKLGKAIKELRP